MRKGSTPYHVDPHRDPVALERVDFADRAVTERFLQSRLHETPSILPVERLDGSFAPILSLGREILSIDNLFVTPNARLVLIETKLWRNPQAVRQVFAQILDYASRLSSLGFEEFDAACRRAVDPVLTGDTTLHELVSRAFPDDVLPEAEFHDALQRNLRNARFMLLIVGDGIRENLESMIGHIHQHPRMLSTFGLIEMQVYRYPESESVLLIPQIVARTTEIVRAVVRVEEAGDVKLSVSLPGETADESVSLSDQEFIESFRDPASRQSVARLIGFARKVGDTTPGTKSVAGRVWLEGKRSLVIFRIMRNGSVRLTPMPLIHAIRKHGIDERIVWDMTNAFARLLPEVGVRADEPRLVKQPHASELAPVIEEILEVYRRGVEAMGAVNPAQAGVESGEESDGDGDDSSED